MAKSAQCLRENRDSYVRGLIDVIKKNQGNEDNRKIFCFVEGKDSAYYEPRVSTFIQNGEFISSKGKEKLKELLGAIRRNRYLSSIRYIAFFDRDYEFDLDDILGDCNFVTSGYSLENKYIKYKTVRNIVRNWFFKGESGKYINHSLDEIMYIYRETQRNFHESVKLFNQWAWIQRYKKRSGSLDLDCFKVKRNCRIDFLEMKVTQEYNIDSLNKLFSCREPVDPAEFGEAARWFENKDVQQAYRGKQEADFLFEFITFLSKKGEKGEYPFKEKTQLKGMPPLSREGFVQQFSPWAETTNNFRNFMIKTQQRFETA